ncbi:fascin domain-containing protein, partial [Streptomyces sp.]|uniref:fascin domain-containing protein n=1 Tax=Streptomyces sp. TaxID=1931 RepID=UPI002F563D65
REPGAAANGLLRARSQTIATWEKFYLYYNETTDRYALQSAANGLFVSMENNYTGDLQYALRARSTDIAGTWEEFYIIDSQST